jgi:hypothetical protein
VRTGEDASADKLMHGLQARGVEVEFRYESSPRFRMKQEEKLINDSIQTTIPSVGSSINDMNAMNIYETFVQSNRSLMVGAVKDNIDTEQWYRDIFEQGKLLLESLMGRENVGYESQTPSKDLHIDSVRIRDFGPYGGDPITYPIAQRGLVLLRGKSSDGTGADSNGSGKVSSHFACCSSRI